MKVVFIRSNAVMPDPRVEKEVNSLLLDGHDVKILAWNREFSDKNVTKGEKKLLNGSANIFWFNIKASFGGGIKSNLFPLMKFQLKILIWLIKNRKNYDVIHACDFDTVIPAWLMYKIFSKKYIYDIFDYYVDAFGVPANFKRFIEKIDIKMMNDANAVIIVNEARREQIKKANPRNLEIIHNSPAMIDVKNQEKFIDTESSKLKFVYVGILSKDRFLKEILEIFSEKNEWELHIGGFGSLEEEVKCFSNKCDNIFFYGKLAYEDTLKLESECDIMFAIYDPKVPNHKYSSPNKLYEAMMLGKPIVVCKDTGIDGIISEYSLGVIVDYDKNSFIEKLNELQYMKNEWINIEKRGKKLFLKEYSWENMEKKLVSIYKNL